MSTPILTPPPEVIEFEPMLEKLSDRLEVKDRPRLRLFVHSAIQKVLLAFMRGQDAKMDPGEVKYRVPVSTRIGVHAELAMVAERRNRIKELCSVGFRMDKYRGVPDGTPFGIGLEGLPPLVNRQRVQLKDIKPADTTLWVGASQLKNRLKECGGDVFQLDVQLDPSPLAINSLR